MSESFAGIFSGNDGNCGVDELNRPLGQKPEPKDKAASGVSTGLWLSAAGLIAGLAAIGLVGWQMLRTEPEPVITAKVPAIEQPPTGQTASGSSEADLAEPDLSDEEVAADDGESGLVELKPQGSLAIPEPRPPRAKPQEAGNAHLPDPDLLERGATGVIPKRSPDGRRAMDVYAREPDTSGNFGVARVVLIVGGMGLSQTATQQAIKALPPTGGVGVCPLWQFDDPLDAGSPQERP